MKRAGIALRNMLALLPAIAPGITVLAAVVGASMRGCA